MAVPDTSGSIRLTADLRSKQISVSTQLQAPREGRSKGRVSWLLRQLHSAPDTLTVEARLGHGQSLAGSLAALRENPELLYPPAPKEIRQFVLTFTRNMGVKKDASKGSFVDSVLTTTQDFYTQVLQNLRSWKPAPPKARERTPDVSGEAEETVVGVSEAVEDALEAAQEEQEAASRGAETAQD